MTAHARATLNRKGVRNTDGTARDHERCHRHRTEKCEAGSSTCVSRDCAIKVLRKNPTAHPTRQPKPRWDRQEAPPMSCRASREKFRILRLPLSVSCGARRPIASLVVAAVSSVAQDLARGQKPSSRELAPPAIGGPSGRGRTFAVHVLTTVQAVNGCLWKRLTQRRSVLTVGEDCCTSGERAGQVGSERDPVLTGKFLDGASAAFAHDWSHNRSSEREALICETSQ